MTPPSSRHSQRRADIVAAARRVAAERGLAQTNVRAVAAEADVSAGSILYYFSSFDDVLYASVEAVVEEFYTRRRAIAESMVDPVERMRRLIVAGIPDTITDDLRIVYESVAFLRERPQYRPLMRSVVERQVMLYRSAVDLGVGLGVFTLAADATEIARNLVALEDAYDLYPLIGLDLDRDASRAAVRGYAALALGCPAIGERAPADQVS